MIKHTLSFPDSFPTPDEELLLNVLLCPDETLKEWYAKWKEKTVFDDIPYAVLGLMPLLHLRLSEQGIVDELTPRLQGIYKYAWVKNQLLIDEVRKLVAALHAKGIVSIVLKGASLLSTVYKDTGARFLGDADILVHGTDALSVLHHLVAEGWTYRDQALIPEGNTFGLDTVIHAVPLAKKSGIELEIHWHIYHVHHEKNILRLLSLDTLPHEQPDDAYHFEHAVPFSLRGIPALMLSPEDLLVHLISHGADGNATRPFRWVVDAAWLLRSQKTIDWKEVIRAAEVADRSIDLMFGLQYLAERGFAEVPSWVISALEHTKKSDTALKHYFHRTRISKPLLGNFPLLWYRYFKFESKGGLFGFPNYLARRWGLKSISALPWYIASKYVQRFKERT